MASKLVNVRDKNAGDKQESGVRTKRKRVSKKNKSAWRKHTDIRDIEGFLEEQRREERTGGPVSAKANEELFFVDAPSQPVQLQTSASVDEKRSKLARPLRCHSALLPNPHIVPARVSVNVRTRRKRQCKQKEERLAAGKVSAKDRQAAEQRAAARQQRKQRNASTIRSRAVVGFDLWAEDTDITAVPANLDEHYADVCKIRRIRPPVHYHHKPSGISAVEVAPPGASYNPAYDDHQTLLAQALTVEEARTKEEERIKRAMDDKFPMAVDVPNEMTWMSEMSAGLGDVADGDDDDEEKDSTESLSADQPLQLSNNPPVRRENKKTEKERRRLRENVEKSKSLVQAKEERVRKQEIFRLKSIKRDVAKRATDLAERATKRAAEKEKRKDATKKLGKVKFSEATMALKLSDELEGSLRLLKPEGHILEDRFKSLQRRNIIEPRVRAKRIVKYRKKVIEKKGHRAVAE